MTHSRTEFEARYRSMVYRFRKCSCGALEIKHAGPFGDGRWHSITKPPIFKHEHENIVSALRKLEASQ